MTDFEVLYEKYRSLVYGYLHKLCGDKVLTEELEQETFFRAYINIASLRESEKAASWLCQIAKNASFAWYNEQKRMQPLVENTVGVGEDPESALYEKERGVAMRQALQELKEPYKEVFTLHVMGGVSLLRISELFGKSESWARVTFYRGKQQLKERIGNQNEL